MPTSFTLKEDNFLRRNYLVMPVKAMAKKLGRSGYGTKYRMNALCLVVPAEVIERFKKGSRFIPGQVSWNKGKGMSKETRRKVKHTWFAKGHNPHNTRKNGDISIRTDSSGRPYQYIRTALGRWELLHRVMWRKENGRIPKGKVVAFINGNSMDCQIGNLMLTDKVTIMKKNSLHNLHPEIVKAKQTIGGFNRKLNKYVKDNQ